MHPVRNSAGPLGASGRGQLGLGTVSEVSHRRRREEGKQLQAGRNTDTMEHGGEGGVFTVQWGSRGRFTNTLSLTTPVRPISPESEHRIKQGTRKKGERFRVLPLSSSGPSMYLCFFLSIVLARANSFLAHGRRNTESIPFAPYSHQTTPATRFVSGWRGYNHRRVQMTPYWLRRDDLGC